MAFVEKANYISAEAGADLSADIYKFVVFNSSGQVELAGSAGVVVDGVVMEGGVDEAGKVVPIAAPDGGIVKVEAAGVINPGALVATSATGLAAAATTGQIAMGRHVGKVAAAAGDIVPIQFAFKGVAP